MSKDKLLALKTRALGLSSMLQLAYTLDQSLANSLLVVAPLCSSVFAVLKAQRLADEDGSASMSNVQCSYELTVDRCVARVCLEAS